MKDYYIQLTATKAFAGVMIQKIVYSPIVWALVIIGGMPTIASSFAGDYLPLAIYSFIVVSLWHIISVFLQEVALSDAGEVPPTQNLALHFSADLIRALSHEKNLVPFSLLRAAVHTKRGKFVLNEIGIEPSDFLARFAHEVEKIVDIYGFIVRAKKIATEQGESRIDANVILYFFFQHGGPFTQLLNEKDLSLEDLQKVVQWEKFHFTWYKEQHTWRPEKLLRTIGTFGRSWVLGYTSELDRLTTDISTDILEFGQNTSIIHTQEIDTTIHIINRSKQQNVLILGKPGVGKTEFVRNLTYILRSNEVKHSLPYTRVLSLHTDELLSATERPDMVLLEAMKQAKGPGRFILAIEDISIILRSADANLLAVFSKILRSNHVSIIGIADAQDYHTLIKKNTGIDMSFEKLFLPDASPEETMTVMMTHYFTLEEKRHMHMTYKALKSIFSLSQRFIGKGGFPGKAIAILNDAVLSAKRRGDTYVTESDVREMISLKAHMNINTVTESEKTRLLNLEESLQKSVIGQDRALHSLTNSLKRARLQIQNSKKPLGTFLFLGPTGVGKTETAKVLAKEYFGSEDAMIRLDMNEYSTEQSIGQIIGAPNGGDELSESYLARRVQDRPFSLILLDEIEKAHPKVLNVFLQILDEGVMRDNIGAVTDFRNTIIIATSNAGALFIRDFIKEHQDISKEKFQTDLVDTILQQGIFSPEFINRFDEIILYYPLNAQDALRVAIIMIDEIIRDLLETKGIFLKLDEEVVTKIAKKGHSQEFGAREMRRTVTDVLENYVANYMLNHDVKRGEEIYIRGDDIHI